MQPVVIVGSKYVLNEHNRTGHSGTVKVIYLPAFNVTSDDKEWYDKVREEMQSVIDEEEKKGIYR